MFRVIGITREEAFDSPEQEAGAIRQFLESGAIHLLHIRKTKTTADYTFRLLSSIPEFLRERLILHSHYDLAEKFELGGIHVKKEVPLALQGMMASRGKSLSRSCHSIEELQSSQCHDGVSCSYFFLSPIFDSISKSGYASGFSLDDPELQKINQSRNVIALGGVRPEYFQKLYEAKFAGAALLGYLWSLKTSSEEKIRALLDAQNKILKL